MDEPTTGPMTGPTTARALWRDVETVHAVTYFADEVRAALDGAGCRGFWMGYFGARAAPLGAATPGTVVATFANFAPSMVERAVPDVWGFTSPSDLLAVRAASAAAALRRVCMEVDALAADLVEPLHAVVMAGDPTGRPLFAANQALARPEDDVAALWQCCTSIREHRGDGHVAALVAEGLSGLDAHHLQAAAGVVPADRLREARGWTTEAWTEAGDDLVAKGLVDRAGRLTADGREVKSRVEDRTDRLAAAPWDAIGDRLDEVRIHVAAVADAVRRAAVIPVPNPIGLR